MDDSFEAIDDDSFIADEPLPKRRKVTPITTRPWVDKYVPIQAADLAVNPSKVKQVETAMREMPLKNQRILVLSGPAGSGKLATIEYLAKHRFQLPIVEFFEQKGSVDEFENFLLQCRFRRGANKAVIVVEEFPNVFHPETMIRFRNALNDWLHVDMGTETLTLPLLVLVVSELEYGTAGVYLIDQMFTPYTLLGRELLHLPRVVHIKFNAVAARYANKLVNRVVQNELEAFRSIPGSVVTQFCQQLIKTGDIRSMLANLETWTSLTEITLPQRQTAQTNKEEEPLNLDLTLMFIRQNLLSIFHAVGKIIFGSSALDGFTDDTKLHDFFSVEQVLATFSDDLNVVSLGVVDNFDIYRLGDYDVKIGAELLDYLLMADQLGKVPWVSRELGLRGARALLTKAGKSGSSSGGSGGGHHRMAFPANLRIKRLSNQCRDQLWQYQWYGRPLKLGAGLVSLQQLNLVDGPLVGEILNRKFPQDKIYGRIGGRLRTVTLLSDIDTGDLGDTSKQVDQFVVDCERAMALAARDDTTVGGDSDDDDDAQLSDPISDVESEDDFDFSDDDDELLALV